MADTSSITQTKTLDDFYSNVISKEANIRLECFSQLEKHLSDENNSVYSDDLAGFLHGLLKWIECSNYRISFNGLRLVDLLIQRLDANEFEPYLENVVPVVIDRLGDGKDQVREATCDVLIKLMTKFTPQRIWDIIQPLSFENKQFRIKEESQRLLARTLNEYVALNRETKLSFETYRLNLEIYEK